MTGAKAQLTNTQTVKQLRREHAALQSHYVLMQGLALISDMRIRKYLDLLAIQRAKKQTEEEEMQAIRQAIRQEASIDPKARMLFDENRELDLYAWGPLQLFFCVAWAFVDRYRYLTNQYPEDLVLAELDLYIEENRAGLHAIKRLRDWVLHPGARRRPDDAMTKLFSVRDGWRTGYPLQMMNRLVELAGKFLVQLNGQTK